jgi:hypothetical protein
VTATPCTPEFRSQLRKVAYRPDGFNEFLYAPGGRVHCTINVDRFDPPLRLGKPDFIALDGSIQVWVDRSLNFLGLNGLTGSIGLSDPFAIILPAETIRLENPAGCGGDHPDHANGAVALRRRDCTYAGRGRATSGYLDESSAASPRLRPGINSAIEALLAAIATDNVSLIVMALLLAAAAAMRSPASSTGSSAYWSRGAFRRHPMPTPSAARLNSDCSRPSPAAKVPR